MNPFELYCMVFFVLDAEWDKTHNAELGAFLSSANPFLYEDIGSAIPEIFENFCRTVSGNVPVEESYNVAKEYIRSLKSDRLLSIFAKIDRDAWKKAAREYLRSEHKGA